MMMSSEGLLCTLPAKTFSRKKHGDTRKLTFSACSMGVQFCRLLKRDSATIIPNVSNWDLLNTVIALYDVCLPDIGVEILRSTVCAQGAKTILLLRDHQDVLKEYQDNVWPKGLLKASPSESKNEDECVSMFSAVFSDSESSEEDDDSDSDKEESKRFHSSLEEFLPSLTARRHQRRQPHITLEAIGIECCIVAALTYKKSTIKSKEKIIEISLLSTRRRYRGCGAARYLLQLLKDVSLVGFYNAIVTHADNRAIELFTNCDFSDDIILNNRFRDLEQDWTNTTTMSYFPPFSIGQVAHLETDDLEAEMTQWREKSMEAHEAQAIFMRRILQEIKVLRKQVKSQKNEIQKLSADLENERKEKKLLQKKVLEHQLMEMENIVALRPGGQKKEENNMPLKIQDFAEEIRVEVYKLEQGGQKKEENNMPVKIQDVAEEIRVEGYKLVQEKKVLEHQLMEMENIVALRRGEQKKEENNLPLKIQDFAEEIRVEGYKLVLEEIVQAALSWQVLEEIKTYVSELDNTLVYQRLYYCDRRNQLEPLMEILNRGFSPGDVQQGEHGKGIYFSASPAAAISFVMQYSGYTAHHVLVADVYIGKIQTDGVKSTSRTSPPREYDSIQIPGRWSTEFVIFSHLQAIPVGLLKYTERDSWTANPAVSKD